MARGGAQGQTFRVVGYREFMRATARADRESRLYVRHVFREVGARVRDDASRRIAPYDSKTAAGYKVRVRQRGVAVEQSIRRTTGTRPDYGGLQMRKALLPALDENAGEMQRELEHALGRVAAHFEAGPP